MPSGTVTHPYGVRDIERLLGMPAATLRALVAAGFVTPARGARRAMLFSFQDLIVLRAAQSLVAAQVPQRRILRSLRELRRQLPESMPLSGLSISAVGDQVVVRDGAGQRQAESGQYLLAFEVQAEIGPRSIAAPAAPGATREETLDEHIDRALGLHEAGHHAEAESAYRAAIAEHGDDSALLYNLALLLEDTGRDAEAAATYEAALRIDPDFADAHYNLALLCEKLGRGQEAIRHISRYRKLTK
ncbi:MAG TPA: tetratricopeptide repeat protein [Usitatibacter sp.]|nr:tetratricopeptide repeat protein [Usitatibacter sp.]